MQGISLRLVFYVALWYGFTLLYNITNKRLLNSFPFPVFCASLQLLCCIPFVLPAWLHTPPVVDKSSYRTILLISFCHGLGSVVSVIGVAAGSVAFSQAIRGAEPIFCAILSMYILRTQQSVATYTSLCIIVLGICMVSLQELDFSWRSFLAALACGMLYQLRSVLAKAQLAADKDKILLPSSLSGAQLFRIISIVSCIQMVPVAVFAELTSLISYFQMYSTSELYNILCHGLLSGSAFYIYNEVIHDIHEQRVT